MVLEYGEVIKNIIKKIDLIIEDSSSSSEIHFIRDLGFIETLHKQGKITNLQRDYLFLNLNKLLSIRSDTAFAKEVKDYLLSMSKN